MEIYLFKRDQSHLGLYQHLKDHRAELEKEFGCPLVWDEQEHLVSRRIRSHRLIPVDLDDASSHSELIEWFLGEHKKFKKYVLPRVYEYETEAGNA